MSLEAPKQDLTHLEKAIDSFVKLYPRVTDDEFMSQQDDIIRMGLEAGLIQNFEFTYELCWKEMKRWLDMNVSPGIADGVTRRELFRLAAENLLIEDVEEWMSYHAARNDTSHRYGMEMAKEVLVVMANFSRAAQRLLAQLQERND
jgi:nucleotidyltransferase substrate binding protein (TIGR01987 family)